MIFIYRWILGLLKKEHVLRTNYHRSHPYFLWYMGLDVILSFALVFGGYQLIVHQRTSAPQTTTLKHAGAKAMPLSEFIAQVRSHNLSVYWLGPMAGVMYAINHIGSNREIITYLPKGSDLQNIKQPKLIVETYADATAFAARLHTTEFAAVEDAPKHLSINGNTATFDINSMKFEIVRIKGDLHIVVIDYPTVQSEQTMLENADNLKLVL